jgi:hypothetical protein
MVMVMVMVIVLALVLVLGEAVENLPVRQQEEQGGCQEVKEG